MEVKQQNMKLFKNYPKNVQVDSLSLYCSPDPAWLLQFVFIHSSAVLLNYIVEGMEALKEKSIKICTEPEQEAV